MVSSMLRGFLNIVVLKALAEGPKSGYALMNYVQERAGSRPSPGSIYPLLEQLRKDGLVETATEGRSKEYRITPQGRKKLKAIEAKRSECLCSFLCGMKMLSTLTGEDMSFPMAMVESMRRGVFPFKEINPEWDRMRDALFRMLTQGTLRQNATRVRKILAAACRQLQMP